MTVRVEHNDCLQAIPCLVAEGVVCDAVVTDPPYHLSATVQRFGGPPGAGHSNKFFDPGTISRVNESTAAGATARLARGFMGQQWDGGDIAFRPETWATIATILRPGAFLVAFGGTRTYHRLVCAIEDAGFVVQDQIAWLYSTGFPKRRDMLKPAHEPICLAYKPGGKRTMGIDECRIPIEVDSRDVGRRINRNVRAMDDGYGFNRSASEIVQSVVRADGRWPANVAHDGSDEVLAAFPDAVGAVSNGRSGLNGYDGGWGAAPQLPGYGDIGSAARFFYTAKADKQDRWGSRHPTVKPIDLIRWLVRLVTPPGGLVLDPFAGSGTTGAAAFAEGRNAILIEREAEYIADIERRIASLESSVNQHSAVTRAVARAVKTRQRIEPMPVGGLFDRPYDESADLAGSYYAAIEEIGHRVKAGEPVPECMLKQKEP